MATDTAVELSDRWRTDNIHWHLFEEQRAVNDKQRFGGLITDRLSKLEQAVAYTPGEVADWIETRERELAAGLSEQTLAIQGRDRPWPESREQMLRSAHNGSSVAGGVYTSPRNRVVDLWAVAMPLADCPRHR